MFFFTEAIIRIYLEDWFSNEQNFVKLGIIFYQEKTPLQGDQIGLGYILGEFFNKLIRSPCSSSNTQPTFAYYT
jgi:hypothetical protein